MDLSEYFENTKGTGVLATADEDGKVDIAIYARPHVMNGDTVAFIMSEKLSYHNVTSNPSAAYLFQEDKPGHKGKRLYLKMTVEDDDQELIDIIRRKIRAHHASDSKKHLVYFHVEKIRELTAINRQKSIDVLV